MANVMENLISKLIIFYGESTTPSHKQIKNVPLDPVMEVYIETQKKGKVIIPLIP